MFRNRKLLNKIMFVLSILMVISMILALFGSTIIG